MSVEIASERYLANVLADRWEQASRKLSTLAEAIPAEAFEKSLIAELRTPGAVLRHVAFWNQYVAASLAGKPFDDSANELSAADYPDKQSVLRELARSSREVFSLVQKQSSKLKPATAEVIMAFIEHTSEHYGNIAVYARLMGIVPPASRS